MARYTGPVCRLCRRERTKLFLKGERCMSLKCPMSENSDRQLRSFPPGMHGASRQRQGSEYLTQLREKQKARRIYGVLEQQFRNLYEEASRRPGMTGTNLLQFLELRLDNVAYRAGWGASRSQARQFVRHGHVTVNGKRVTIPSYRVRPGEVVAPKDKTRTNFNVTRNRDTLERTVPGWLETSDNGFAITVRAVPAREQIDEQLHEQLIVELYSK
jgi:small subunit ribosomal protein S4